MGMVAKNFLFQNTEKTQVLVLHCEKVAAPSLKNLQSEY